MKLRDVGLSLLGSTVVYVSMAACNAGGGGSTSGAGLHAAGGGGTSGPVASAGTGRMNGTGGTGSNGTSSAGGTDGTMGASGTSTASGVMSGADSGLVDALTDPVATASADPTDGSRLKATYMLGSDGSKQYVPGVWYDSMRSEDCAFTLAGDSQQRCLPAGVMGGMYSDSACSMPIAAVPAGCTTAAYATNVDTSNCGGAGATHIYALGATTSPTQLYVQSNGQCYAGGPAVTGYTYYALGAEIAPATFVAATSGHD
jgi:hypothetical protein